MASYVFSIVGSRTFQIRCPAEGSPIAGDQATTLGQKATQKNSWASGSISSNHLKTERKGTIEYCWNRTLASRKGTRYFCDPYIKNIFYLCGV